MLEWEGDFPSPELTGQIFGDIIGGPCRKKKPWTGPREGTVEDFGVDLIGWWLSSRGQCAQLRCDGPFREGIDIRYEETQDESLTGPLSS